MRAVSRKSVKFAQNSSSGSEKLEENLHHEGTKAVDCDTTKHKEIEAQDGPGHGASE
jgi:hypothetical protein